MFLLCVVGSTNNIYLRVNNKADPGHEHEQTAGYVNLEIEIGIILRESKKWTPSLGISKARVSAGE